MSSRFVGAFAALAAVALIATGCAPSPELEPAPAPSQAAPKVETPTPTPTPTPFVPDCYNIISEQTQDTLTAEGFVLIEEHERKLRTEQRVELMFFENGGVDCMWGVAGGGDSLVVFGYSEITPAAAAEAQDRLAASDYVRTEDGDDVIMSIDPSADVMGVGDAFLFSNGEWFHSTTREAIAELRENVQERKAQE